MTSEHPAVQAVRVLDVLVVGPLMLAAARQVRNPALGLALQVTGWATIFYNGARWWALRDPDPERAR